MTDPIVKTLDLPCAAARAFEIFTRDTARWWPGKHSVSSGQGKVPQAVNIEAKPGGAIFEIMHDGSRCDWGQVLEFEDGVRMAMSWHPGDNGDKPTRVEVAFEDLPGGGSRLTLTHSGWEVWGDSADERRGGYNNGWDFVLVDSFLPACG